MPIYRTGKPQSGTNRDATINKKGSEYRGSVYDYDVADKLDTSNMLLAKMILHLQSITGEEFNEIDTKDLV